MNKNPERLAWVILLASFFTCVGLVVAVPLGVRWYIRNAQVVQQVSLEVQRAPLSVTLAGRGRPVSVSEDIQDVPERTVIGTNATAGRLVIRASQSEETHFIATVQIYDQAEVVLASARSPRFDNSPFPHQIALEVQAGRVRISVPGDSGRPTMVKVRTPQGTATLQEGRYVVEASQHTTQVTVKTGLADLANKSDSALRLGAGKRTTMEGQGPIKEPLPAPRDLIINGDFTDDLGKGWVSYNEVDIEEEPEGEVQRAQMEGHSALLMTREGVGHAATGIRQELNAEIRDFSLLQLHLLLRVEEQSLRVCGTQGSECPVMVRIEYEDTYGADREWLQGFYWLPNTATSQNPLVCETCSTRREHIRVPRSTWYAYLSPNLMPMLSQDGQAPTSIETITVYASGHTYQSAITEIELIAQE